jgi:hypothetical protein
MDLQRVEALKAYRDVSIFLACTEHLLTGSISENAGT